MAEVTGMINHNQIILPTPSKKMQKVDAANRIKDMCLSPLMALEGESLPYVPPLKGIIRATVVDGFKTKDIKRVISSQDRINLTEVASQAGPADVAGLINQGMKGAKIRIEDGIRLLKTMMKDSCDITKVLFALLPQMESNADAKQLIFQSCANDRQAFIKLKHSVGTALRPIMGSYNGFFRLDLASVMDRLCFSRLLEVSATQRHERQKMTVLEGTVIYDLSQKRNW